MADPAPHAAECCPAYALRALTPAELAALGRYCQRTMADPDAEPRAGDEAAAVRKYEALLTEKARAGTGRPRLGGLPALLGRLWAHCGASGG